jgi:hypothetical protein
MGEIMTNIYRNRDFYLSAFLISKGCKLIGTSKENPTTTLFEFEDTVELRKLVDEYYTMNATTEVLAFVSSIRSLKSVIHATDTNTGKFNNGNRFINNR